MTGNDHEVQLTTVAARVGRLENAAGNLKRTVIFSANYATRWLR
jgi:hypothetical protein